jgi:predicted HTH transcriptional regulator
MTVDIAELLAAPEGKTLEFKRDLSSLKQVMKTVIAFANTAGGTLIIGREDDGSVVGVEDPLLAEEKLSNAIEIISWERSHLLFIRVAHWPGPFYIKKQGPVDGVYIRLGSTNRKAGPEFIAEIERMQKNKSFDQLPCPSFGIEALDMPFLQKTFSGIDKSVNENQLDTLGILTSFGNRHVVTLSRQVSAGSGIG